MPPIRYDELLTLWGRGDWGNRYAFTGAEDFLIEEAVDKLRRHVLPDATDTLNATRLDGNNVSVAEILEAALTVPFFGSKLLLIVDNAQELSAADQKALAEDLPRLPESTTLVLLWKKEWRREDGERTLIKTVGTLGKAVIFWPLFPDAAQRWLISRSHTLHKKTLTPEAAAWLVHFSGEALRQLDQELTKAALYVGGRPQIEAEDVEAAYGYEKATSPYDWLGYVRGRNVKEALATVEKLLKEGEEPILLLAMISRGVREWLTAKASGESASSLAMRFRLRKGEESRFFHDIQRWTIDELTEALDVCVETEQSLKTGKETPAMGVTLLTLRLADGKASYALR